MGQIINKMFRVNTKTQLNRLLLRIPPSFVNVKPATFLFAGGAKSLLKSSLINTKTEVVKIHTFDYDIFLEESKSDLLETSNIVFLDAYLSFHPDDIFLGRHQPTSAADYYPALCKFFDYLEEKLNLEVIIAAHPKSHYEKHSDLFGGRRVENGKTGRLVRNAEIVVLHASTAINFIVLYQKPMIIITTDSIEKHPFGEKIVDLASYFNKTPINISREVSIDTEDELEIDCERYAKYKKEFIKEKGSVELPFWQVVCNKIKSLSV